MKIKYFSLFAISFFFFITNISHAQNCTYVLELNDAFGDGWSNAAVEITIEGLTNSYTLNDVTDDGTQLLVDIPISNGDVFKVSFIAGTFDQENAYRIIDSEGFVIFSDGPSPSTGLVLDTIAFCPSCPRLDPDSVFIVDIDAVNTELRWNDSEPNGNYIVEYGALGFTLGTGTTANSDTTMIKLEGLNEDTDYEFYVSVDCNGNLSKAVGPYAFHTIFLKDVGIAGIIIPESVCGLGQETIQVYIGNYGERPQTLIPFNYSVNGIPGQVSMPDDGLYTGVISNDSIAPIAFDAMFNFSVPGEYEIMVWTEMEEDGDISNDTITKIITHIPIITSYPYLFNFELWGGGWLPDEDANNSSWQHGEPVGAIINSAATGRKAWVTNLEGDYNLNELSYLISPCLDFSTVSQDPLISFTFNFDSEACCDKAWVEKSVDDGNTWEKIGTAGSGINWYNNADDDWWDGTGGANGWRVVQNVLEKTAGEDDVRVRLVMSSDGTENREGFGFDNIVITHPLMNDAFAISADHFSDSECGSVVDSISLTILNNGTAASTSYSVAYQVNNEPVKREDINGVNIAPNQQLFYRFQTPFNSTQPGIYNVKVWADLSNDLNFFNDTTYFQFEIATPAPLPLVEDFEDQKLPEDWTSTATEPIGNGHNNTSFVLQANLSATNLSYEVESNYIGPINSGDSLTFDYRYTDFVDGTTATTLDGDKLLVEVSTDCGDSYITAGRIDANNHFPTVGMTNFKVDLDQFAGENIRIRFLATRNQGNYWLDIDNVNIIGCPPDLGLVIQKNSEKSDGSGDGSIEVNPMLGTMPYTYDWGNATTNSIDNLSAGMYTITITDAIGCEEVRTIDLAICPESLNLSSTVVKETSQGKQDGQAAVNVGSEDGPFTYTWSSGDDTKAIKNLSTGNYIVTVTDVNGCQDIAMVDVGLEVSTNEIKGLNNISLAPNPTNYISTLELAFEAPVDVEIQLFNIVGQKMKSQFAKQIQHKQFTIDLSEFSAGLYFVRIVVGNQFHTEKLLRTR